MTRFNKAKKAFSLIELSIVILIIGILVAGVTQSSRLVNEMRLATVRNINQNSPIHNINNLIIWLDATNESSFIESEREDGQKLSEWNEINIKKTQRLKLIQTDVNKRPIYTSNAINKLPAVKFDDVALSPGVRVFVYPSAVSGDFIPSNQSTVFMVLLVDQISYVSTFYWDSGTTRFLTHSVWPDNNIYFDFGTCCDATSRIAIAVNPNNYIKTPRIMTYIKTPTTLTVRSNLTVIGSASGATATIPNGIVADFSLGSGLAGKIGEFVYFNRALKAEEIQDIEAYLSKKWAIK